jgi:hypothetical protein
MEEVFRQSRKPINPSDIPGGTKKFVPPTPEAMKPKEGLSVAGPMPPAMRDAIRNKMTPELSSDDVPPPTASTVSYDTPSMVPSPKTVSTGNSKLDELLEGIKETVFKYEKIELPSRGKFYTEDIAPTTGIIHVKVMTGEEESILTTLRHIKRGQAIDMIFKNCVRENIVPEKLLVIDRTYLLIYLRGISNSTSYDVELKCKECSGKFNETIDLDTLMVEHCPDDFDNSSLSDKLPTTGYKFNYRLPTGKDENQISDYRDKLAKNLPEGASDDTWVYRASLLINDIEGLTDRVSIQTLIKKLPMSDVSYIRNRTSEPPFGVDTKIKMMCPLCTEEFTVELPMDTSFFFPKPRKGKPTQH